MTTSAEHEMRSVALDRLRRALTWWDYDTPDNHGEKRHGQEMRDEVVRIISQYEGGDADIYTIADRIIQVIGQSYDAVDQTLSYVIPDDHWGIAIPDTKLSMEDFVEGRYPQVSDEEGEPS